MSGLGPHGTSLLERLGRSPEPPADTLWLMMDQSERSEARQAARVRHAMKHKAKVKPLAPVEQTDYKSAEGERMWRWIGEDMIKIKRNELRTSTEIRTLGFKLPKLKGKKDAGRS